MQIGYFFLKKQKQQQTKGVRGRTVEGEAAPANSERVVGRGERRAAVALARAARPGAQVAAVSGPAAAGHDHRLVSRQGGDARTSRGDVSDHAQQGDQDGRDDARRGGALLARRPVPDLGLGGRLHRGVELHHGQDTQGSQVPGAGELHDDGGRRALLGLQPRLGDARLGLARRQDPGVEDTDRSVSAPIREGTHQGPHLHFLLKRLEPTPHRLVRLHHKVQAFHS